MATKLTPKQRRYEAQRVCSICKHRGDRKFATDGSGKTFTWTCNLCWDYYNRPEPLPWEETALD